MAIGQTNRHKFYIVRKEDDPPSIQTDFTDYSGRWLKWNIKGNVSQVSYFEGIVAGEVDTDDFKKGNLLYVMSGTKLIGKFVIDRPEYKSDRTVVVKGYQSTGSEQENRKMLTEIMTKIKFKSQELWDIFTDSDGVLVDEEGSDILAINSMENSTDRFTMSFDYDNRIAAMTKACVISEKEWVISHGVNDSTPYSEGDGVDIINRVGSAASSYTFTLSGTNRNCTISTGNDEIDSMVNEAIVKGTDQNGTQVESRVYDATGTVTYLDGALDGWLYEDISGGWDVMSFASVSGTFQSGERITGGTSGDTAVLIYDNGSDQWDIADATGNFSPGETVTGGTSGATATFSSWASGVGCVAIKIHKNSGFPGLTNFRIKIDSERIFISSVNTSNPDYDVLNVKGQSAASTFGRGLAYTATQSAPHRSGSDVCNMGDESTGILTVAVEDTTGFDTSGTRLIRIGSENMSYNNQSGTTFTVDVRSFSSAYAHGDKIRVSQHTANGQTFNPSNPDTSTTSSIRTNGPKTKVFNEVIGTTKDALDRKAQSVVENKSEIQRISLNVSDYFDVWSNVDIGDTVTLSGADVINISDGSYRLMGFEYDFDYGRISLILFLNSNDTRTWASTEYTYVDEVDEIDQPKRQDPSRNLDGDRFSPTTGLGVDQGWGFTTQLKNVIDPVDPFDGVNKKYVDEMSGGGPGVSYWETLLSATAIQPVSNRNVVTSVKGSHPASTSPGMIYFSTADLTFYGWNGSSWLDLGAVGGGGFWNRDTSTGDPYIYPAAAGDDVNHNGGNLGQSGYEWPRIYTYRMISEQSAVYWETDRASTTTHYIRNANASYVTELQLEGNFFPTQDNAFDLGWSGGKWSSAYINTGRIYNRIYFDTIYNTNIRGSDSYGFMINDDGTDVATFSDVGIDFFRSLDVHSSLDVSGGAYFDGDVQLGNASGDDIYVDGRIVTHVLPDVTTTRNLGSSTYRWNDIYGDYVDSNFVTVNADLTVSSVSTLNGHVYLGSDTADNVYVRGYVRTDIVPYSDGVYDLGSSSRKWEVLYVYDVNGAGGTATFDYVMVNGSGPTRLYVNGDAEITTDLDVGDDIDAGGTISATDGFRCPVADSNTSSTSVISANSYNLFLKNDWRIEPASSSNTTRIGGSSYRIYQGYFTNLYCTNQTSGRYITGTAFIELNLLPDGLKRKLVSGEDAATGFEEGDVLVWKDGKLIKSHKTEDKLVQAVASDIGTPIVMGAEKIKVLGHVNEGDYLVSHVEGLAIRKDNPKPGTVIAQALETSYEQDIRLVKAMIRKM